jgi:hypothetical protein
MDSIPRYKTLLNSPHISLSIDILSSVSLLPLAHKKAKVRAYSGRNPTVLNLDISGDEQADSSPGRFIPANVYLARHPLNRRPGGSHRWFGRFGD